MKKKIIGFTLAEVMVAVVLGSLIMGAAYAFWSSGSTQAARYTLKMSLQHEADLINDTLSADLKAAKAGTFEVSDNPLTVTFDRYVSGEPETGMPAKTIKVTYRLAGNTLTHVRGGISRELSKNVEVIQLNRGQAGTGEGGDNLDTQYMESKIDVDLELRAIIPGTTKEEKLMRHTSVVMREEYYSKIDIGRNDLFAMSKDEQKSLLNTNNEKNSGTDMALFKSGTDLYDEESLASMSMNVLKDMLQEQKDSIKSANDQIDQINKAIDKTSFDEHTFWTIFNTDLQDKYVDMRDGIHDIKCGDKDIPEDEKDRASTKLTNMIKELDDQVNSQQQGYIDECFGNDAVKNVAGVLNDKNPDPDLLVKATQQKQILEMYMTDKLMKDKVDEQNKQIEKEKKKAEEKGEEYVPKISEDQMLHLGIEQYQKTKEQIEESIKADLANKVVGDYRRELMEDLASTKPEFFPDPKTGKCSMAEADRQKIIEDINAQALKMANNDSIITDNQEKISQEVEKQFNEQQKVVEMYNKCAEALKDKKDKDFSAYQGAVSLKNSAETKRDLFLMKESAILNKEKVEKAINTKSSKNSK